MKVLIIEDEKLAADKLGEMLKSIEPDIEILAKIGSVKESVKWLMNNSADLIFLDIQLSDGISFNIFEQVMVNTPVIFTTAYDQYAVKAFQLNSIAYLLKPVRKRDLEESLRKFETFKSAFIIDFGSLLAQLKGKKPEYKKRFMIQIGDRIRKVEVSDIACFYSMDRTTFLKTFTNKNYPVDQSLDKLESLLDPEKFFRINRKYIVNMDAIKSMVAYSRGRVKLELDPPADNETDAIVSIERSSGFKKWLNK
ncbi:MAG: LytTR family DNA-binding domain-containing protein [Bacteroidales bacterium]|nr:LytTR family DNA-binding domain-containing protein [Bacteroidales bacterium]